MAKIEIEIQSYLGYVSDNAMYSYGRVLEKKISDNKNPLSKWHNFKNAVRNLESDEVPFCPIVYTINNVSKKIMCNSEGFYLISEKIENANLSLEIAIDVDALDERYAANDSKILAPLKRVNVNAKFGIISDIDDTILQTDVLSKFKWRLVFNSLFIDASQRNIIADTNNWYRTLSNNINPVFYISNSPWNMYKYLMEFLQKNNFPNGPILLRDFGKQKPDALQNYEQHKATEIERMLLMYPQLPFILIGDGGEKDADIYLAIKQKFPEQVKAIFVHRLGDVQHQARIEALSKGHEAYFYFVHSAKEGEDICKNLGFM